MAIKAHFTAEHCRRITWAIIDDGRSYFDNVKTTLYFGNGASVVFPQSFIVPGGGNGKVELKSVSSSSSDVQCHAGLLPNDREGMSAIAMRFR
jgi:hypothetical protein